MGDTPNEKMSRVRNLIRFPATGRDRRIRLEESRDPRIRFVTKLRFVCGWLLAVGRILLCTDPLWSVRAVSHSAHGAVRARRCAPA